MNGPRIGSLFSGYGGLDMGVQAVIGGTIAWHVEFDDAASRILAHHWPNIPNYGDITKVDWSTIDPVEVLTGGFPCTDISSSGKKEGIDDGEFSGLWREYARAIRTLRPRLIVVENVRDILTRGLDRVVGDLAELGYDSRWTCVSGFHAGGAIGRARLFLTGTPAGTCGSRLRWGPQQHCETHQDQSERPKWIREHADRLAVESRRALDRWAELLGRPAPNPEGLPGANRQPRLNPAFVEWLMGLPEGHVTDPAIGLTHSQHLKAIGNGVMPQQAALGLRLLLEAEVEIERAS